MRQMFNYSEGMMQEAVDKVNKQFAASYTLMKDSKEAYFVGLSPRETRYRLELFVPFLQECPTKAHLYWNADKECWTFWRDK